MADAIAQQKPSAVRLLHEKFRTRFDHNRFRQAVFFGCNKVIIEIMVEANANPGGAGRPFIYWEDADVEKEARCMVGRGDAQGQWLLDLLHSRGNPLNNEWYG